MRSQSFDANHFDLINHGQAIGARLILDMAKYGISCDTLWGFRGEIFLIEIKNPETVNLKKDRWHWLTKRRKEEQRESEQDFATRCEKVRVPYYVVKDEKELRGVLYGDQLMRDKCRVRANDPKRNREILLKQLNKR